MKNILSRRHFLKNSTLALAGAALSVDQLSSRDSFLFPAKHLGLQLWSVREDMGKDAAGTVKALAGMGYREVEGFGYNEGKMFGMPIADFSKLLKDNGISMPTSHCPFTLKSYDESKKSLTDAAKKAIDDAASIGQRYIVNPWMDEKERPMIDKHPTEVQAMALFREGKPREAVAMQEQFLREVKASGEDHCSCPAKCPLHGNCVDCVIVHRGHADHLPHCFRNMVNERLEGLSALTEHSLRRGA